MAGFFAVHGKACTSRVLRVGVEGFENFHSENVSSNEGKARITYVNTGVLSGNEKAQKTAMEIFEGEKTLAFSLREDRG